MNTILIVGSGDVAQRLLPWLIQRLRVLALVRNPDSAARLRALGATPIIGDLDIPASLTRLSGIADWILHCAPPPQAGRDDARTRRLLAVLSRGTKRPRRLVYISTTGVYGDRRGAWVTEKDAVRPATPRALRRVAAERRLREFAICVSARLAILRAPGIYAAERLSLARLERGDPVLTAAEDVFTNHIHADDLARAAGLALFRSKGIRVYNACDDSQIAMGDYYDAMADIFGMRRPPRAPRAECARVLPPATLSFMAESRRIANARIKRELRWRPVYPDVIAGLRAANPVIPRT